MGTFDPDKLARYQAEQLTLFHIVTTPFRWLISAGKWLLLLLAVGVWLFFSQFLPFVGDHVALLWNRGAYSVHQRQIESREMSDQSITEHPFIDGSDAYMPSMEFIANSTGTAKFWSGYSHDTLLADFNKRVQYKTFAEYRSEEDTPDFVASQIGPRFLSVSNSATGDFEYTDGVPGCSWSQDRIYKFDTRLPKTLKDRRYTVFVRKSARMSEAFREAALSMAVLRYTLTSLKFGVNSLPGGEQSGDVCDADDPNFKSEAEWTRWNQAARQIHIDGAPVIRFRLTHLLGRERGGPDNDDPGIGIMGMCLESECDNYAAHEPAYEDLSFRVDRGDLRSEAPILTPHQENAIAALKVLSSDAYWLTQAHKNGVHNDQYVLRHAEIARELISSYAHVS